MQINAPIKAASHTPVCVVVNWRLKLVNLNNSTYMPSLPHIEFNDNKGGDALSRYILDSDSYGLYCVRFWGVLWIVKVRGFDMMIANSRLPQIFHRSNPGEVRVAMHSLDVVYTLPDTVYHAPVSVVVDWRLKLLISQIIISNSILSQTFHRSNPGEVRVAMH